MKILAILIMIIWFIIWLIGIPIIYLWWLITLPIQWILYKKITFPKVSFKITRKSN